MMRSLRATMVVAAAAMLAACAAAPVKAPMPPQAAKTAETAQPASPLVGRETVNATLWMQRAAEYRIATTQAFGLATDRLASSIAAPGSAALEQREMDPARLAALPTAVIVDLDETILDNSYYQARRALAGGEYDEAAWQSWMMESAATPVPGAREFLAAAARAGHRIFYV
ncbi:MAG: acid phosphatase, partial [Gammaproteobacteria bacterium]|nr:acid phosphatase [Gammaproteobacteria bacterium]